MIGIRTPWTLADERVWDRTHRLARWPAMLSGLAIVLLALAAPEAILPKLTIAIVLVLGAGLVAAVVSVVAAARRALALVSTPRRSFHRPAATSRSRSV